MTQPTPEPGAPSREPDADGGVVHMWRLVAVSLGEPAETEYRCDLCGDTLVVHAGGAHPTEC